MKTDPISAATAYRRALEAILSAQTRQEARQHAAQALEITFAAPSYDEIGVDSGLGGNTGEPFVALSVSNPVVQLPAATARRIGHQILEAADAAESDGFIAGWMRGTAELSDGQVAALLANFRAYREQLRKKQEEAG